MSKAVVTAALTGPIATKADNPNLPTTPEEIAEAARGAYEAGAAVVHVHLRDADGQPDRRPRRSRSRVVDAVERGVPRAHSALHRRRPGRAVRGARATCRGAASMASLNPCSMSFGRRRVPQPPGRRAPPRRAGCSELGDQAGARDLRHRAPRGLLCASARKGSDEPLQFSIVMGVRGGMPATPTALVHLVARLPSGAVWQAIAIGRANLSMTAIGLAMGGNARTGMEDTLLLRRGVPASPMRSSSTRLVAVARSLEREVAGVEDVEQLPRRLLATARADMERAGSRLPPRRLEEIDTQLSSTHRARRAPLDTEARVVSDARPRPRDGEGLRRLLGPDAPGRSASSTRRRS